MSPIAMVAWSLTPDGKTIFVAGGVDDNVHTYRLDATGQWVESGTPIPLGHAPAMDLFGPIADALKPMAAGVALTPDGQRLFVANYENDSVSSSTSTEGKVVQELDLRPGKIDPRKSGQPGGEFPYWIAVTPGGTAYVSSLARPRDRRSIDKRTVACRGTHQGRGQSQPHDPERRRHRASSFRPTILIASTKSTPTTNKIVATITVGAPHGWGSNARLPGAAPNSLALSPDEKCSTSLKAESTRWVSCSLTGTPALVGLIPTAWQPNAVSVSGDGRHALRNERQEPGRAESAQLHAVKHQLARLRRGTINCTRATSMSGSATTGGVSSIPVPDADTLKRLTADHGRQ